MTFHLTQGVLGPVNFAVSILVDYLLAFLQMGSPRMDMLLKGQY